MTMRERKAPATWALPGLLRHLNDRRIAARFPNRRQW